MFFIFHKRKSRVHKHFSLSLFTHSNNNRCVNSFFTLVFSTSTMSLPTYFLTIRRYYMWCFYELFMLSKYLFSILQKWNVKKILVSTMKNCYYAKKFFRVVVLIFFSLSLSISLIIIKSSGGNWSLVSRKYQNSCLA